MAKRSPKRTPGHASPKKVPRQRSAAPGTAAKAAATKEESPVDSNVAAAAEIRLKAAATKEAKAKAETAAAAAPKAKKVVDKVPAWKKAFQESLKAEKRSRVDNRAAEQRRKRDFNAAQLAMELKRKEAEKRKALRRKADKAKFELPDAGGASTRRDAEAAELQAGGAVDTAANPLQITRPPLSSGNPLSSPPPPPKGSSNSPLHKSGKKDRGGAAPSPSASGLARHRGRGAASTGAAPAKSPQMSTVEKQARIEALLSTKYGLTFKQDKRAPAEHLSHPIAAVQQDSTLPAPAAFFRKSFGKITDSQVVTLPGDQRSSGPIASGGAPSAVLPQGKAAPASIQSKSGVQTTI